PATEKNAPVSIMPSSPMLITPDRSESSPPRPVKSSGVMARSVAVRRARVKKSLISGLTSRCCPIAGTLCQAATEGGQATSHFQRGDGQDDQALDHERDLFRDAR